MHNNILVELKKFVLLAFVLVLLSTTIVVGFVRPAVAEGTIYIKADGSVVGTTHISSVDNVTYIFTDNINDSIVVERDNIVVDGAGYTLQGTGALGFFSGVYLYGRSNVTIKNIEINAFPYGIGLSSSSNNSIHGNSITNNTVYGIWLTGSSNNSIYENSIPNNWNGIRLSHSSNYNSICGNNITNNGVGIVLGERCTHNSVYGNNITANNGEGIRISYFSNHNSIYENNITNNHYGIYLFDSSDDHIFGNNITNNDFGVGLDGSNYNKFYHNRFINNTGQVYMTHSGWMNYWDDGYPTGGNYWSDYKDRYPNATEIDGSGLWDTSYIIDGSNQDNYPIVPEFPTWTSMLLLLILLTVAMVLYKRRLLKTPN